MRHPRPGFFIGPHIGRRLRQVMLALGAAGGLTTPQVFAQPLLAPRSMVQQPTQPPLTRVAFAALLQSLQRRSFGDEQLDVVRAAIRAGGYFTCEQAGQLIRASAFGDAQVKIAATLYPQVVDPENLPQLVATLTRADDRQKLRDLIGL